MSELGPQDDLQPPTSPALLEAQDIGQRFGAVEALSEVNISLFPGEVHALLGDNGAGKSTLIKVLSGVLAPTRGTLRFEGVPVRWDSPRAAQAQGVATVHQHLALAPLLSIARNFVLGREPVQGWLRSLDIAKARDQAKAAAARLGVELDDPNRPIGTLSGGQRQCVAIARALHYGARVLILDEPTSALGVRQAELVLEATRRAADEGLSVLLITHQLNHAWRVAERFTLLERGQSRGTYRKVDTTKDTVLEAMAGSTQPAEAKTKG